jgi:hypothetical protein
VGKKLYDGWTGERIDHAYTSGRLKRLQKDARRVLRGLGVTPLDDIMAEVIRAESRSDAADVARAYLVALTRRVVGEYVAQRPPDLQEFCATRLANHVQRIEARRGFELPALAAGMLALKEPKNRGPKKLPPRTVRAEDAPQLRALPPAPSLFDDQEPTV